MLFGKQIYFRNYVFPCPQIEIRLACLGSHQFEWKEMAGESPRGGKTAEILGGQ